MRKASKNRTDDDVSSSTNGSAIDKDGNQDAEQSKEKSEQANSDVDNNESADDSDKETPKRPKKTKSMKNKSKKKKGAKAIEDEENFEIEKILNSKRIKGKLHYLIRWKGFSADDDTWEPESSLSCPELLNKYNEEKENSKDKDSSQGDNKSKKRKSNTKTKSLSKKAKVKQPDDENSDETAEYEVERILEVHHKKSGKREFLIHWKGWSSKFNSWEPESNLKCPELIKKFMEKVEAARSSESRSLRVAPETTNRFTLQDPTPGRRLSKRQSQRQRVRYDNAE